MSFSFTDGQKQAIYTRGRSLLVSAAAGSGKTRVLTERVMSYVTDPEENADIDRFLIITYTRAAAGEMRSRIMDALADASAANPLDRRLRRQQDKCWQAQIGTIHSFCTNLLREHCHLLGLPPAFRVMDEDAAERMKASVLDSLLESRYEKMSPGFQALCDSVGAGRDDRRLGETVLSLYEKIRSHPYPLKWTEEKRRELDELSRASDAAETPWGQLLLAQLRSAAEYWSRRMDKAVMDIYSADEKIIAAYGGVFEEDAAALRDFVRALSVGWDYARKFLPPEDFAPLGRLIRYSDPAFKDRVKAVRDNYKKAAAGFRKALAESSEKQLADMQTMAPSMEALLRLCEDFDRAYSAEKRREGLVDFSDLEHLALELLVEPDSLSPSPLARELSGRYREIMVDEYQDVNAVQDMIFRALSREGRNLFMVGDVKQSIYRFRLADPGIFLEKYGSFSDWSADAPEGESLKIMLRENFRSRKSVLDAANLVFSNIMSRELGELDYDEDAALRYAAPDYPEGSDSPAELWLIDPKEGGAESDADSPELSAMEARFVARRIREMMDAATPVYEKGTQRPCRWSDFVILMRSPGGKGGIFHTELSRAGIPVRSRQSGGFFSSLEVGVALDMLSVIDNPHSDVALISVLRSPAFGFSADELAAIRSADKKTDFYSALLSAAEKGNERCRDFAEKLSAIREAAPDMSPDELLWRVYTETELFSICSAMEGGHERRANLMRLFELARSFGESGYKGLFRFVAWLRRMAERGQEPPGGSEGDFVSIMSIHKSKGLEFPFVFLCDLKHQFNKSDSRAHVLIHSELGLGPRLTDAARGIEYPTLARKAIEQKIEQENLSEEMRVLYVAMTRAREKLIMSAPWKNASAGLGKLMHSSESPLPPAFLRTAQSPVHWLASAALLDSEELISLKIISGDEDVSLELPAEESEAVEAKAADTPELESLRAALDFVYPHEAAVELPTKLSATELEALSEPMDPEAESLVSLPVRREFRRPRLGGDEPPRLSAAEIGTATHIFMQYVDFERTGSMEELRSELERMLSQGLLSPEEGKAVKLESLLRFFGSESGALLKKGKVHRELRFTLLWDAAEVFGDKVGGEELLMQGVIDCLVEEPDGLIILDYKTDRVTADTVAARAELYRSQIEAYARSACRIFGKRVKRKILCFLRPGISVEL